MTTVAVCDVSVIIPAYNASETIARALGSVLAQSLPPAEIIVVDDASSDAEMLKAEIDAIVLPDGVTLRLLHNDVNLNGAASRNRGILSATKEVVAFLDADDEWEPEKLRLCLEAMAHTSRCALVYSQVRSITDEFSQTIRPARGIGANEHMSEYLFLSCGFVQTSTIVCPRDLAAKVKFNPAFHRHQDYDFCLRVAVEDVPLVFIEQPLVRYYVSAELFGQRHEDPAYTTFWGETMRSWMSSRGYHGYHFFLVSGRLLGQRRYGAALRNAITHALILGPAGLWKARFKAAALILALMRR